MPGIEVWTTKSSVIPAAIASGSLALAASKNRRTNALFASIDMNQTPPEEHRTAPSGRRRRPVIKYDDDRPADHRASAPVDAAARRRLPTVTTIQVKSTTPIVMPTQ